MKTVQKPISIKKLAGPVLVLVAAVGIGMVIREFRFRSSGEKHVAQAPKAVQPGDLPVIKYRIQLVEDLSPYAMDKTNADAFDEAHKDLVNMANRLARQ